jgi:hypothetical protein
MRIELNPMLSPVKAETDPEVILLKSPTMRLSQQPMTFSLDEKPSPQALSKQNKYVGRASS